MFRVLLSSCKKKRLRSLSVEEDDIDEIQGLLSQLTKGEIQPGSKKVSRLKKLFTKIFELPTEVMAEVVQANIEEEKQFFQEARELADEMKKSRENARAQRNGQQDHQAQEN